MDFDIRTILYVGNAVGTAALAVYLWLRRRHDRNAGRIGEMEEQLNEMRFLRQERKTEVDTKVAGLTEAVASLAKSLDILRDRMGSQQKELHQVSRDTAEIKGRLVGVDSGVTLILEKIVNEKKE